MKWLWRTTDLRGIHKCPDCESIHKGNVKIADFANSSKEDLIIFNILLRPFGNLGIGTSAFELELEVELELELILEIPLFPVS